MCFSGSDDRFDTPHDYTQTIFMEIPHFRMGIEVMTVWKKLLANARIGSSRGGHHHQSSKHSNPTIILYKTFLIMTYPAELIKTKLH